jgi:cell division protein FtsB
MGGPVGERARRVLRRVLLAAAWLVSGYYFLFGGEFSLFELRDLRAERDSLARRVDSLQARADSLDGRAEALAEDSFVIEKTARERYGFIRDGERLFRFLEAPPGEEGDGG